MVQRAVEEGALAQSFQLKDTKDLKHYTANWDMAFGYINSRKKIFEMPWQRYLVLQLAQLIIEEGHSILVSVGTGHGKSVIIQMLADILALHNKKVVIVCLQGFLAFWGSGTYGSPWVN